MIQSIAIKNFMAHSDLRVQDIPQINVIIGKNDTGKTAILKLLYSTVKALEVYSIKNKLSDPSFREELAKKISNTFMPRSNGLGDLVQKGSKSKLEANITLSNEAIPYKQSVYFSFGERSEKSITNCSEIIDAIPSDTINAIFIPAKEVLTAFSDIRNIRDNFYGVGFDDTYLEKLMC